MGLTKKDFEIIGGYLAAENGGDVAILPDKTGGPMPDFIYYTAYSGDPKAPRSAIVDLIQGMNDRANPVYRLLESSSTVYHTGKSNLMDDCMAGMNGIKLTQVNKRKGEDLPFAQEKMIKLPNFRWSAGLGLVDFILGGTGPNPAVSVPPGARIKGVHNVDRLYMMAAYSLVTARFTRDEASGTYGNIGALLVADDGRLLGWALNTKDDNSTYHAEVNLIQSYCYHSGGAVPADTRVYTTLKPCQMCAGMILQATQGKVTVIYGQDDASKDAKNTPLDRSDRSFLLDHDNRFNAKPVMLRTDSGEKAPMPPVMDHFRKQHKKGGIVAALGSEASTLVMMDAVGSMHAKMAKYGSGINGLNAQAEKVLNHLKPFLVSKSATLQQIIEEFETMHGEL